MKGSGGLGAIYPAMANSLWPFVVSAIRSMIPLVQKAMQEIESLKSTTRVYVNEQCVDALHLATLPLPHLGHGIAHQCLDRNRDAAGPSVAPKARRTWLSRQTKTVGIGFFLLLVRSREDGIFSLKMNFIRM